MRKIGIITKVLSAIFVFSLICTLAACSWGALKLESFTVDRATVKTEYYVGDEIDFSGIKAFAKYSDTDLNKEYTYSELTVDYDADITATPGSKTVKVSFMDPHLDVKQETTVIITVSEDPNAVKHASYAVDASAMKTEYVIGDTIDFTGIKIIEKFTNGGADAEVSDLSKVTYEYADSITATAGIKTITVKYDGENAGAISITVSYPAITSTVINTSGVNLEFNVGDTVNFNGLSATVNYENGDSEQVTNFTFVTDISTITSTPGEKNVIVKYDDPISGIEQSGSFAIKVDGVIDYTLSTAGMTLEYLEGDTVSFAGINVTAIYKFAGNVAVPFESLTFVHEANLTSGSGNKEVTVKVGDIVVGTFIVKVGDIPTASANTDSVKLSYRVGESVSLDGLTVTLTYTDGTSEQTVALSDLTVVTDITALTSSAGTKTVTVKYLFDDDVEILASFNITVYGVSSYTIDTTNMKTTYIAGGAVDLSGLAVWANYLDGGERVAVDVSTLEINTNGVTATAGNKTIEVKKDGQSIGSLAISVSKNSITSATVGGNYENVYEAGTSVDLTGLTVTLKYTDGSERNINLSDITVPAIDTATVGNKPVVITFTDPINNEEASASFSITVIAARPVVSQFEKNSNMTSFDSDNANAGTLDYGAVGFSGQYLVGGKLYTIGDDNAFKFLPTFSILENGIPVAKNQYYTVVDIYLYDSDEYIPLTKSVSASAPTVVSYYHGEDLIAVVDTYNGSYEFKTLADKIKISVMPSEDYYKFETAVNPVIIEARVIDAYNVYEAWQLAVIDNDTDRTDWVDFKTDKGIAGVNPAGIVLHNDIHISENDVPASFFHTSAADAVYTNNSNEETTIPKGTRFLKDGTDLYVRVGSAEFTVDGNFFTLDVQSFPLVPSPAIFFGEGLDYGYGSDFSNATLFKFATLQDDWQPQPDDVANVTFENIGLIGNASRNSYVDANGNLTSAGGLIFTKSARWTVTTFNNVIGNSFFITYFPETQGDIYLNKVKCYDSYQNAGFIWGESTLDVTDSFFNGAGGPLFIAQSVTSNNVEYSPTVTATNTVTESHLSGQEIWFTAVNANAIVGQIQAMGNGLQQGGLGNFSDANGQMNIVAALMSEGSNAAEIVTNGGIQGELDLDGNGIDRWYTDPLWGAILSHGAFSAGAPFITVYDDTGAAYTLYIVADMAAGTMALYDLNGAAFNPQGNADHAATYLAFLSADYITLSQGGLSVVFEFYHN